MNQPRNDEKVMHRYLLGDLSEADQMVLEQEYFADPEKFEQMWAAENDLIDRYVRGQLLPDDRARFERHYLASPQHRQRVAFAQSFLQAADTVEMTRPQTVEQMPQTSLWQSVREFFQVPKLSPGWALAAGLAMLLLGGAWLLTQTRQFREQLAHFRHTQSEQQRRAQELEQQLADQRARSNQLAEELERLRTQQQHANDQQPRSTPSIFAFVLGTGLIRGSGETPHLVIPPRTDFVQLRVKLEGEPDDRYQALLRTVEGEQILSQSNLTPRTKKGAAFVSLKIPTPKLSPGDYILTLTGLDSAGETTQTNKYFFRVSN